MKKPTDSPQVFTGLIMMILILTVTPYFSYGAESLSHSPIDRTRDLITRRIKSIDEQLRNDEIEMALFNINQITRLLKDLDGYTGIVRKTDPGFSPNLPVDINRGPVAVLLEELRVTRKLAEKSAKQLDKDHSFAGNSLSLASNRQDSVISLKELKFQAVANSQNTEGNVCRLTTTGTTELNSHLKTNPSMGEPMGIIDIQSLEKGSVSIQEGRRLLTHLDRTRRRVADMAHQLKAREDRLLPALKEEEKWRNFKQLSMAPPGKLQVEILDFQADNMKLWVDHVLISPDMAGRTLAISPDVQLQARVWCRRRVFCLENREYAGKTKYITVHPAPGGRTEDHLSYSSPLIPVETTWRLMGETLHWEPSKNTAMKDISSPETNAEKEKIQDSRIIWQIHPDQSKIVTIHVTGQTRWSQEIKFLRKGEYRYRTESNTGSATLTLKIPQ